MKTKSILKTVLCLTGFSVVALTGAQAQILNTDSIVNVQFGYDGTFGVSMNGISSSATAAPLAYVGNVWNVKNLQATGSNLLYSDSSLGASTIGYVATTFFAARQNGGTNTLPLLDNRAYAGLHGGTLQLTGLNNSTSYDLTLEVSSGSFFDESATVGANTASITVNNNTSTWVNGQNYMEFDNITPTGGDITVTFTQGSVDHYITLSGFQIGAVSVPEPSSFALLGLGAAMAVLIRGVRRRSV